LEYIVSEARRVLGSNASAIYRHQDPSEGFRVQTAVGRVAQWTGHAVLPLQLAQALRQGQPVAFSERPDGTLVREHAGLSQLFPPNCLDPECQALLAVPLIVAGEIYGALVLYYAQPRAFHEEEVNLAVAFADQATLSIENAHLHRRAAEAAVVQERARLARELHDSVTQSLYSLTLLAEGWRRLEAAGRLEDADDPLTELGEIAQQALKEMRLMVYELRPPALEQEGLLGALHQRLGAVEQRAGVEARLLAQEIVELPARTEEGLYRIAIEALNNALKHASATTVTVHIRVDAGNVRADVEQAILEVVDDGVGFDVELNAHSPGMGLRTMRERAEELGGTLAIRSAPGEGARIVARVPL
jgi:signal transduction histidine kinase